ncbi:MAG: FAD-dependent oxidoreductase [Armatimonadetes bacterium]|nr:FAD-dependent oxidoreductase [Armatimonadota bacterium]
MPRLFQVHFTAYPHAQAHLDYDALTFRAFLPGAMIWDGSEFHRVADPSNFQELMEQGFSRYLSLKDKLLIWKWTDEVQNMTVDEIDAMTDEPTVNHLVRYGFSDGFLAKFARPFFGGIFLDRSLSVSRKQFAFVWKMLSSGQTVIPARGIAEIPLQLAAGLNLRTGAKVMKVDGGVVTLAGGETLQAEKVIVATEGSVAASLGGVSAPSEFLSSTCVYFQVPEAPVADPILVLRGDTPGIVNHLVPCSLVSPELAPDGKHLVSVTVLGLPDLSDEVLSTEIREELSAWFPKAGVNKWQHLRTYRIPQAQLRQPSGFKHHVAPLRSAGGQVFFAGEYTTNSSIDGAIESGEVAATCAAS